MAQINLIDKGKHDPGTAICPRCKRKMIFDLGMFKSDITKVVQSKCPYCKGKLFTCVLILTNTSLPALMNQLKNLITAARGDKKIIS